MIRLLQIDASARPGRAGIDPHGSHTRRLTHHFIDRWLQDRPGDIVVRRDVGAEPPRPVSGDWIHAAFTPERQREAWMGTCLAESDALTAELIAADVIVVGTPMYNFGMPAALKAWLDNVVRIGLTFGFDPSRGDDPYIRLLAERPRHVVVLSSRGGHGMEPGGPLAHMNHLEPHLRTAFGFIGLDHVESIAVEHEEEGGDRLATSFAAALAWVEQTVARLQRTAAEEAMPLVSA